MIISSETDLNKSNTYKLLRKVRGLTKSYITTGINKKDNKTYPNSDTTTADVGLYHEFGTLKMPPRMWLRIFNVLNNYKKRHKIAVREYFYNSVLPSAVLNRLGSFQKKEIRDRIISNKVTPRSYNDTGITLVDTGQLVNSIDYEVRDV